MELTYFYQNLNNHFIKSELINNQNSLKTICLDFDGVVIDPSEIKSKYLIKAGYNIKPDNTSRIKCLEENVPENEYSRISSLVARNHIMDSPIKEKSIEIINWMNNYYDIYIVTSRTELEIDSLISFITYYKIKINGIAYVGNKSKLHALSMLNPAIYIDDSLNKLLDLVDNNFTGVCSQIAKCKLFLFYNNANKNDVIKESLPISPIKNWEDIKLLLKYIKF